MGVLSRVRRTWFGRRRWRITRTFRSVTDVPNRLRHARAVLVGTPNLPKWLIFNCPCMSGHRVMVALDPQQRPHWTIQRRNPLAISPSVDEYHDGKRCHYLIRQGRVRWVE